MAWRIGTVPYLVARPLVAGLDRDPRVRLTVAPPATLARGLEDGRLDVALASSVLAAAPPHWRLWEEGPVIASDGPIRSVVLLLRPGLPGPAAVRRWIADPHSRTGRALADVVLRELHGVHDAVPVEGDEDACPFARAREIGAEAVQLIGDPALEARNAHPDWTPLDLGAAWKELTGLPFVFAGWIARPGLDPAEAAPLLGPAAEAGLARRDAIAEEAAAGHAAPGAPRELRGYLREDVRYRLSPRAVRGALEAFGARLHAGRGALP